MIKIISYLIFLLVILLGITFSIMNSAPVNIHYYFGSQDMPLSMIMAISFGSGLFLGLLMMGISMLRMKADEYRLKKRLKMAELEIENLRSIPIKEKIDIKL